MGLVESMPKAMVFDFNFLEKKILCNKSFTFFSQQKKCKQLDHFFEAKLQFVFVQEIKHVKIYAALKIVHITSWRMTMKIFAILKCQLSLWLLYLYVVLEMHHKKFYKARKPWRGTWAWLQTSGEPLLLHQKLIRCC